MYLWQKSATQTWWKKNETRLVGVAGDRLAIIERPNRRRLQLELASQSRTQLLTLTKNFNGRIQKLPRDWLKGLLRRETNPLKIGTRELIIPAGAAFGTGEHATTAMSLRLLEKFSRNWKPNWSIIDLGTGSGVLALAAKLLGASRAVRIDNDSVAISTARQNARLNRIDGVQFRLADVRRCKSLARFDVATANLFSELLIEILPMLKHASWLILSGILRDQERKVARALARHKIDIIDVRRRGKWVAILGRCR
jgi:ribosomal protein L11 methyltransferase